MILPTDLTILRANGLDDMGDVTDVDSPCRFRLDTARWCLAWLRVGFQNGTGTAMLSIRVDHGSIAEDLRDTGSSVIATPFDFTLYQIEEAGVDGWHGMFRVPDVELRDFMCQRGDTIVLEWTNPNTQEWAVEVALIDAALIH